ncbi:MAG: hypothetical protein WC003_12980 [Terrimicrobiaceae bacterium]
MLSELFHIAKNLSHQGKEKRLVHADFGEPGLSTNVNLRLLLSGDGRIVRLEALQATEAVSLWTLKKGGFRFFPAVRMPNPLLDMSADDPAWKALKKPTVEALRSLLSSRKDKVQPVNVPSEREQASRMMKWNHEDHEAVDRIQAFAGQFLELTKDGKVFAMTLATALEAALISTTDEKLLKPLQVLLCGVLKEPKNKPSEVEFKVQVIFDYLPKHEVTGCLYNPRARQVVLECLNAEKSDAPKKGKEHEVDEPARACAFEGRSMTLLDGPYPDWSAQPVIGKAFKPFSKFSDAPCNYRYHVADSDGFAIGSDTAKELVAAGCTITSPESRNKTWRSLRNGKFDMRNGKKIETRDVLIAYPSFDWKELVPVSIFGRPDSEKKSGEESDDDEANAPATSQVFSQVAETFVNALMSVVSKSDLERKYIRLLVLRAISPGQVQLAYSATPTCGHFAAAVQHWIASEKNLPPRLTVPLPSKKAESGFGWFAPNLLFPDDAIHIFSHQWMRGGTESSRLQAPPVSAILDVFLQRQGVWQDTARQLLETLLPRVEPLLIGAGNILHRIDRQNPSAWRDFAPKTEAGQPDKRKPDPRYYLAKTLSLIGTLLHALNSTPNHYMKETAYLVGKLLAAMDELHKCYCVSERKGDIPPTLIGNGLLGRAADSPEMAFDELCERSRIYLGWAKAVQLSGKETDAVKIAVHSARKLLRIVEPIAAELHQSAKLNQPMSAEGKTHLFLGYLSPVLGGKKEPDEAPTEPTQPE